MISGEKGRKLKRNTELVIISVLILTIATMNVSYSAFFSVQTDKNVQQISTGNLDVTASTSQITVDMLLPSDAYQNITTSNYSIIDDQKNQPAELTITNNGSVDASFGVSVTEVDSAAEKVDLENIIIAILKPDNTWLDFGSGTYYVPIASLKPATDNTNYYPIIKDTIDKKGTEATTKKYKIYVWLKYETDASEIGKKVDLNLSVKSVPASGQNSDNSNADVAKTS